MPRTARIASGGIIFHALSRANNRDTVLENPQDFQAYLRGVSDMLEVKPMRILRLCLMPNHWHFVLWPQNDGDVGRRRVFNLGYYTWVEWQGAPGEIFDARCSQSWWDDSRPYNAQRDGMVSAFNEYTGASVN